MLKMDRKDYEGKKLNENVIFFRELVNLWDYGSKKHLIGV